MLKCDFNKAVCNFIDIPLWHGYSPVNLLHIFRTLFIRTPLDGCLWPFISVSFLLLWSVLINHFVPQTFCLCFAFTGIYFRGMSYVDQSELVNVGAQID